MAPSHTSSPCRLPRCALARASTTKSELNSSSAVPRVTSGISMIGSKTWPDGDFQTSCGNGPGPAEPGFLVHQVVGDQRGEEQAFRPDEGPDRQLPAVESGRGLGMRCGCVVGQGRLLGAVVSRESGVGNRLDSPRGLEGPVEHSGEQDRRARDDAPRTDVGHERSRRSSAPPRRAPRPSASTTDGGDGSPGRSPGAAPAACRPAGASPPTRRHARARSGSPRSSTPAAATGWTTRAWRRSTDRPARCAGRATS